MFQSQFKGNLSSAVKVKKVNKSPKSALEDYATSADGTRIWYAAEGRLDLTPIVFCNGLGCSTFFWKHLHAFLKRNRMVVLFDWRGHGKSTLPKKPENISIDCLCADLDAVITKLKLKKAILIGHSMGVQTLYRYYEKHPSQVAALIPCFGTYERPLETFYDMTGSKYFFLLVYLFNHLFPRLATTVSGLIAKNPFWFQMGSALKMLNPGLADKKVLRQYIDHITQLDPVLFANLMEGMQEYSARHVLPKVKVPTLIVAGEQDTFTPLWTAKKMNKLIPRSELFVIKKATHVGLVEQPALINLRIEKFFEKNKL